MWENSGDVSSSLLSETCEWNGEVIAPTLCLSANCQTMTHGAAQIIHQILCWLCEKGDVISKESHMAYVQCLVAVVLFYLHVWHGESVSSKQGWSAFTWKIKSLFLTLWLNLYNFSSPTWSCCFILSSPSTKRPSQQMSWTVPTYYLISQKCFIAVLWEFIVITIFFFSGG